MRPFTPLAALLLALGACAPAVAPAPRSAPTPEPASVAVAAPVVVAEAPENWQLLDFDTDRVVGTGALRAERELLAGREPKRTVVVAVIDGGVDTAHVDLRANLWVNADEVAGNNRDDDNNGYVDDVYGWNFIGGPDGRSVHQDTYESARLYADCKAGRTPPPAVLEPCAEIIRKLDADRAEAQQTLERIRMIDQALRQATTMLTRAVAPDSLTPERVQRLRPTTGELAQARGMYLELAANGVTPAEISKAAEEFEKRLKFGLNPEFNPRPLVGDRPGDLAERRYGNRDVMGPEAMHGTHVAGIIGAVRGNNLGIEGIAPAVQIMALRAVPDGDERDKDVANAIRYAVDNGAHIINMSFGKSYSPGKVAVDEAVRYADQRGVLLVHAAGNAGEDLATSRNFPTPNYLGGGRAVNWIEVGASSWKPLAELAAPFSNYGRAEVDVFAPGVDILSTVPGNRYDRASGTSMAAPVVTGVAALLMSYFPDLSAAQVKQIILDSATRYTEQQVARPGGEEGQTVRFGDLSATGGVINVGAAIRMAQQMSTTR